MNDFDCNRAQLREQIAQEIEAKKCKPESDNIKCWGVNEEHCEVLDSAAKIARGE